MARVVGQIFFTEKKSQQHFYLVVRYHRSISEFTLVESFHFYQCFLEDNTTTKLFYELPKVQLLLMQFRNFSAQGCHGCKSQSFSQRDFPIRLEFIEFQILQVPCIFLAKLTGIDTLWVCSFFNQINT